MDEWSLRLAAENDVAGIEALISQSARGLGVAYYSAEQMEGAIGTVFGVDRQLIRDRTYFVAEAQGARTGEGRQETRRGNLSSIIGCGGWSKRQTLFGSDHHTTRDNAELDPARDPARIRAFFVHPNHARRGVARAILAECERAILAAGFKSAELAATLPGVPFYLACDYISGERSEVPLPNGLTLPIVRMHKNL
jgi:N-acetylglutamate synthase-like GNAT family acetyltransferase